MHKLQNRPSQTAGQEETAIKTHKEETYGTLKTIYNISAYGTYMKSKYFGEQEVTQFGLTKIRAHCTKIRN